MMSYFFPATVILVLLLLVIWILTKIFIRKEKFNHDKDFNSVMNILGGIFLLPTGILIILFFGFGIKLLFEDISELALNLVIGGIALVYAGIKQFASGFEIDFNKIFKLK